MKSSLMVKDDIMCTCQKGDQFKLKKSEDVVKERFQKRGMR